MDLLGHGSRPAAPPGTATPPPAVAQRPRVLVVTANMGAGHAVVAQELARRVVASGGQASVRDLVAASGATGARLQSSYRALLRYAPWAYGAAMRFWARWPRPLETFTAAQGRAFDAAIVQAVRDHAPDVVVSTYNLASLALGRLVGSGQVGAATVTFVVDPGAHPYWVSPHVGTTLALTELTAARLAQLGAHEVTTVAPVLRAEFDDPPERAAARAALGLADTATVVVLTAGSWAVGGIAATAAAVARVPGVVPLVLCGRDRRLLRRLRAVPGVRAVPWTPHVVDYLAAADVVIDNAGGQTCWEALACRTPVLIYRPLPGHGRLNADTLHRAGLATWVRSRRDLAARLASLAQGAALQSASPPPPATPPWAGHADAVEIIAATVRSCR